MYNIENIKHIIDKLKNIETKHIEIDEVEVDSQLDYKDVHTVKYKYITKLYEESKNDVTLFSFNSKEDFLFVIAVLNKLNYNINISLNILKNRDVFNIEDIINKMVFIINTNSKDFTYYSYDEPIDTNYEIINDIVDFKTLFKTRLKGISTIGNNCLPNDIIMSNNHINSPISKILKIDGEKIYISKNYRFDINEDLVIVRNNEVFKPNEYPFTPDESYWHCEVKTSDNKSYMNFIKPKETEREMSNPNTIKLRRLK